jgi:leucyl aminopeptidase
VSSSFEPLAEPGSPGAIPLHLLTESEFAAWLATQPGGARDWLAAHQFRAEAGRILTVPGGAGQIGLAVAGLGSGTGVQGLTPAHAAAWSERLPGGVYRLATELPRAAADAVAFGWLNGHYRFQRYRSTPPADVPRARLCVPAGADESLARAAAAACALARDLINTPASDLGPAELADAAAAVATRAGARLAVTTGDDLLSANFPLIHAVGRASSRAPRLIDLRWGDPDAPSVTLVGKGVCFDTGGLAIKPSTAMLLMKKDMGGAAVALGAAQLLMAMSAPVALRLLIPAVENSVAGNAYRPGDVLRSRRGLTVEIGNTDAEGRLVLADALAEADSPPPRLLLDFATLTGAARVALGPELPAVFSPDEALLADIRRAGDLESDPAWPLPLWSGYDDELSSRVADLNNVSSSGFAGAIFGALFLRRFVQKAPAWAHFDLYAWNGRERPGRPVGAEAQCLRLAYRLVRQRLG